MPVAREKLYEEVWAEPMTTVAERYGVSSSFLARVCERLQVPRPARGHWTRVEMGKQTERPSLPALKAGMEREWFVRSEPRPPPPTPRVPSPSQPPAAVPVTRRRTKTHALVEPAPFEAGRAFTNGYLRPRKGKLVDVVASSTGLRRALGHAAALFNALEARDCSIGFAAYDNHLQRPDLDHRTHPGKERRVDEAWRPDRPTVVFIGTLAIGLTVFELSEAAEVRLVNEKYVRTKDAPRPPPSAYVWVHTTDMPSGRFGIRAYSPYRHGSWAREWRETKRGQLASMIDGVADELLREAPHVAALVAEATRVAELEAQRDQEQTREWLRKHHEKERQERVQKARASLMEIIDDWGRAKRIEEFLQEVAGAEAVLDDGLRAQIAEARALLADTSAAELFKRWKAASRSADSGG